MAKRHIVAEDGKYTVVLGDGISKRYVRPYMIRHGQPWVNNPYPNNVELALAYRVQELEDALVLVRDRFFPADQPERDRDLLWEPVNKALELYRG